MSCYLRFRELEGDPISDLIAAIPRAAHWHLAALPDVLSEAEIDQLMRSFDEPFPSFRRDYAIVRCLADLGLRGSEVANLQLEAINWRDGTICLEFTKTHLDGYPAFTRGDRSRDCGLLERRATTDGEPCGLRSPRCPI